MSADKLGKDRFGAGRIQPCQVQNACQTSRRRHQAGGLLVESKGHTDVGDPLFRGSLKLQAGESERMEGRSARLAGAVVMVF